MKQAKAKLKFKDYTSNDNINTVSDFLDALKPLKHHKQLWEKLVKELIWYNSETKKGSNAKYRQRLWSEKALKQLKTNLKNNDPFQKNLSHDHTIPLSKVKEKLRVENQSDQQLKELLSRASVAVVVTSEENKRLGISSNEKNPFKKYQAEDINIVDISNKKEYSPIIDYKIKKITAALKTSLKIKSKQNKSKKKATKKRK